MRVRFLSVAEAELDDAIAYYEGSNKMKTAGQIFVLLVVSATIGCSSISRPKPNAYLAPQGRVDFINNGFGRLSFGMTEEQVKGAIGYPFHTSVWRGRTPKMSLLPGERLGQKYTYWMKVASYLAISSPKDDRWLDLYFDDTGRLVKIKGNIHGEPFEKKCPIGSPRLTDV